MNMSLIKSVISALGSGAFAIAVVLLTGSNGRNGFEGVSYKPYRDVAGVWTVCYGHTGRDIIMEKVYNQTECYNLLSKDLNATARKINPFIKVEIPETMRGVLYSFAYNVGAGNFQHSELLKKINQGDNKSACEQLRRWTYSNGKQWKGLITRREVEHEICTWDVK